MKKDFGSFEELAKYCKTKQRIEELSFAICPPPLIGIHHTTNEDSLFFNSAVLSYINCFVGWNDHQKSKLIR